MTRTRRVGGARTRARAAALLCAALCAAAGAALTPPARAQETPGERLPVREITLDNGMRFLVLRREGPPTVAFVVQFGVGGVNEHLGTTGIAHLLEHLLFKGTTTIGTRDVGAERALFARMDAAHDTLLHALGAGDSARADSLAARIDALEDSARAYVIPNELDRIFTEAGARGLNATTSSESTTYFVELPSNRTELWFLLESDRMQNAVFREFYTERRVVAEERRMRIENVPAARLYEVHMGAAFQVHPYGVPVVGYMSDIETLGRREVADYYRRFYGPRNAVVAIVGDVDPDQIERWAREYFGPIPGGEEPPPVLIREPEQLGERRVVVEQDAEPRLRIGWRVPSSLHEDAPALAMLASLLTGGRTSRLHQRLVIQDRLATGVFASLGPGSRFPQLFQIDVVTRSPHTPAEVEPVVYEEIARLANEGPSAGELERVRNQIRAGDVRRVRSNLGLAFQLADSESLHGDWRETFRASALIEGVTAEDVRRVAAQYLTPTRRTVGILRRSEP
ncbi:MAG TPA: pitrilysin family protein [Longimicrobiales bacterium]|nr:pitrilysin family protein [Longimicrobiales bacterium]